MDTNPCPSLFRRWDVGKKLTLRDLNAMTSGVGFEMNTEGQCRRQSNVIGPMTACSSAGTDDKYSYLTLILRPRYVEVGPNRSLGQNIGSQLRGLNPGDVVRINVK
jgi:hypothetical protein